MEKENEHVVASRGLFMSRRDLSFLSIIIPILFYAFLSVCTSAVSRSDEVIMVGQNALPVSAFTGVVASVSNLCLVVIVLFYKRLGFITSLVLLAIQIPGFIARIIAMRNLASIPGVFSSIFTVIMIFMIYQNHVKMEKEQKRLQNLFEQTATALVNAIDAKDIYTHGHSIRVASYAKKLAEMNFKSEKECEEIYYAALLHDVGKIGVPESIISKKGKLTREEYELIKSHPWAGAQILQSIREFPYLSVGAIGHHERFDGKGYPMGLKGSDIPEIARIISVADAYDAMTSKRSYRDPIPQQKVREEIVKGSGTQFDPEYARIMLHLIDVDEEYEMSEREEVRELAGKDELVIEEYRSEISGGILLTPFMTTIRMTVSSLELIPGIMSVPSMILFDSLDGRVHDTERDIKEFNYFEYGEIWLDGKTENSGVRKIQTKVDKGADDITGDHDYKVEAVRIKDHALIRIKSKKQAVEIIIALPDSSRYAYIGLTGEHCRISDVSTDKAQTESPADYIPRIAEEISYINVPAGDIPNVQIDGYRTDSSEGVEIKDGLKITFHTKNLPTAKLVWHCPFIDIFSSDDGRVNGKNYRDLAFMRFDGEAWECDPCCSLELGVSKNEKFTDWDAWKQFNQDGYDATVSFAVQDNRITVVTENGGVTAKSTATLTGVTGKIYAAVTGDQIALTDIRIK